MASQAADVPICNVALAFLGRPRISSLDEPSAEALTCAALYPVTRDTMLEAAPWRWCRTRAALALLETNQRPQEWAFAYARPAGVLRVQWVRPAALLREHPRAPYELAGDVVFTDEPDAVMAYIMAQTDATRWSSTFRMALSWALAAAMAMPLTEQQDRMRWASSMADEWLDRALAIDADDMDEDITTTPVNWLVAAGHS